MPHRVVIRKPVLIFKRSAPVNTGSSHQELNEVITKGHSYKSTRCTIKVAIPMTQEQLATFNRLHMAPATTSGDRDGNQLWILLFPGSIQKNLLWVNSHIPYGYPALDYYWLEYNRS
ncbi:hypothetical protein KIL84_014541 [Mauremys mutica]|uniref:Uncharacterized protein n=1 Tax=Mauremys mutica TaxID=74926 RepID=A0A9D3XRJ3_9SAUR|nr:hypothetical protein KIL84_014541 [Mauremys mutica]